MHNIKEVAKLAKTSTATVSRVINRSGYVSDEMKARVLRAIKELDYKPLQRNGENRKTRTIALVVPDIENPFFAKLTKEISKIANTLDYNILLINLSGLKNDGGYFLLNLISTGIDGIIYTSSYRLEDVINKAKEIKIPIVVLDRELKNIQVDSVSINNENAAYLATEYLIKLGHKRIAFIGGTENMEISINRHRGYKMALEKNQLTYDTTIVEHGDFSLESGYKSIKKLMNLSKDITGIVAGNDLMAIGAINYLNFKGYKIPEDISIVGFDDIELASSITPKLTTIAYPLIKMSKLAIEAVIQSISGTERDYMSSCLFAKLIERESADFVDKKKI
ncbi:LacI family DNA-binding transcriptional regulator [uncultured Ilyobacter sp.]|uniref:LacI family DNA-binding transcriptional regulator n=1 Tax=uncultured Ilyobacter sp. TaxID=544433 RepID=UPI0029F5391F|nr:LacI family DNA-binding transcriptional regulator [uncultured Ilyobacter sp.]